MHRHCAVWIVGSALWLLAGCHGNGAPKDPTSDATPNIVGTWSWVESTGGIAGVTKTPESSGETWTIEFRKDGTFREVHNKEGRTGTYEIAARESIFDHEARPALLIDGELERIILRPDSQTLHLNDNVYDGFGNRFTRGR